MNADTVGYRYSDNELAALRLIMELDMPVGCAQRTIDEAEYDQAIASLTAAKLVTPSGDSLYIDKLTALLLSEISAADTCMRIISQNRVTMLFKCPRLYVVDEIFSGTHTLIPMQTLDDAGAAVSETLDRHELPAEAALITVSAETDYVSGANDHDTLLRAVSEILAAMSI